MTAPERKLEWVFNGVFWMLEIPRNNIGSWVSQEYHDHLPCTIELAKLAGLTPPEGAE